MIKSRISDFTVGFAFSTKYVLAAPTLAIATPPRAIPAAIVEEGADMFWRSGGKKQEVVSRFEKSEFLIIILI
jgi:hypothetical protein